MSICATNIARKTRGLTPCQKLVLWTIADYANEDLVAWPSVAAIADDLDLHPDTVKEAVTFLTKNELLTRSKRTNSGAKQWIIDAEKCVNFERSTPKRTAKSGYLPPKAAIQKGVINHLAGGYLPPEKGLLTTSYKEPPRTTNEPPLKNKQKDSKDLDLEVQEFRDSYPQRLQGSKLVRHSIGEIRPAYARARISASKEEIIGGLERAKTAWDNPQFIPMPMTWLNQKRWNQEITNEPSNSLQTPKNNSRNFNGFTQQKPRSAIDCLADRAAEMQRSHGERDNPCGQSNIRAIGFG